MRLRVIANLVAIGQQSGDKRRIGFCPISDDKEGGTRVVTCQKIGKRRRHLWAGTIVIAQDDGPAACTETR